VPQAAWVWQSPSWPTLTYKAAPVEEPLRRARTETGRVLGKAEAIGAKDLVSVERDVWSNDAVATAAIEGERLELASVRSSVARRLGLAPDLVVSVPRNVEGLLDVMESAAADWAGDLTHERLWRWQAALFPAGGTALRAIQTGQYRIHSDPMQIVSGPIGREAVHYVAPPSAAVYEQMQRFLEWFNQTRTGLDGLVRAALSHVWFESIHPFEDGNGRVGRAILDLALAQEMRRATRLHCVSTELLRRQNEYYDALNAAQRGTGDVTEWLAWFIDVYADSCRATAALIDESLMRARFWSEHKEIAVNERQRKALNKMLEAGPGRFEGGLTLRKYLSITGATRATAWRDLDDLHNKGLLLRSGIGRGTRYDLPLPGWSWAPKKRAAPAAHS
jgi:Fic family protein